MPTNPCAAQEQEVNRLTNLMKTLQESLWGPGGFNKGVIPELATLGRELQQAQAALLACKIKNNIPVPLSSTLSGTASLTISGTPGGATSVNIGLFFDAARTTVQVGSFSTTIGPFKIPASPFPLISTVLFYTQGLAHFDKQNGSMSLILASLEITTNFATGPLAGNQVDDSTAAFTMSTGTAPSPPGPFSATGSNLDAMGAGLITLVGSGSFASGRLTGSGFTVIVAGVVAPHP